MTLSRSPGATCPLFEPVTEVEEPTSVLSLRIGNDRRDVPAYPTNRPGLVACRMSGGRWALARSPRGDVLALFASREIADRAARSLGDAADWSGPRKLRRAEEMAVHYGIRDHGGTEPTPELTLTLGEDMTTPPIVGAELWQEVMTLAGDRCQCQGACGKKHADAAKKPGRCENTNGSYIKGQGHVPLLAIPRDPSLPWHQAAHLPARRLIAFCRPCSDGVRTILNRAAKKQPPQDDGLFATEAYTVSRSRGDAA